MQGGASPGPVDVTLTTARGATTLAAAFTYDEPLDPRFKTVVAFGASLTQGVQNGVPSLADLAAVLAEDPGSPEAMASTLDVSACDR